MPEVYVAPRETSLYHQRMKARLERTKAAEERAARKVAKRQKKSKLVHLPYVEDLIPVIEVKP